MIVRSRISESPIFLAALEKEKLEGPKKQKKLPIWEVLRRPKALLLTMFSGAAGFGLQALVATFAVGYAADSGVERSSVLYAFGVASLFTILFVICFCNLSDRLGRRPVMITGLLLMAGFMAPFFEMLQSTNWFVLLFAFTAALALHGMIYGPLAAFISEQFGTDSHYTGASLGYQLATLLGSGFTPTIIASL